MTRWRREVGGLVARAVLCLLLGVGAATVVSSPAAGQLQVRDLVVTGGVSMEGYHGNLSAVTVPLVDSTDQAAAAVGQFGARGEVLLLSDEERVLQADFDTGFRQSAADGFEVRDYSPREWVGSLQLDYRQRIEGVGTLGVRARGKGRRVQDRPPMPLFIQPGYGSVDGAVSMAFRPLQGVRFDLRLGAETTDYRSLELVPQLDLLDRRSVSGEVGAEWTGSASSVRVFGSLRGTRYPHQGSFDPADPFRRDRSVRAGATWTLRSDVIAQLGLEGVLNRSNSDRPEYDAVSVQGLLSVPLPAEFGVDFYGVLTSKSYIHPTDFARLVPGEEADNASIAYVSLTRPLGPSLDGALRLGWTRAETDIGNSYFERFGATFFLHYRPWSR